MALTGALEAFDGENDFQPYQERLESYFIANDIGVVDDENNEQQTMKADKKKVAYAIAVMGKLTYDTLKDLCVARETNRQKFQRSMQTS